MELRSGNILLRPLRDSDAMRLAELANNEKIGINLRDGFPFPYTLSHAAMYIRRFKHFKSYFAIEYNGEYAGNIGLTPHDNVYRKTAEIGYWLGEPYWNKGIMTTAVSLITEFGFKQLKLARIHTGVYEYNPASQRVLEKCGFAREAVFRNNIFKNGRLHDEVRYAKINPDVENGTWISGE
ncbi:MAG TPA: GNAT family protein [Bacteroidales bacterium]|nr:GNAT family protein [Bacteroidales bacterium]